MRKTLALAAIVLAAVAAGCKKQEEAPPVASAPPAAPAPAPAPLAVGGITLGTSIGPDKKIAAPLEAFGVHDKIYASVATTGEGHARLRALWSFVKGDKTARVNEESIEFDASAPAWSEFHIENSKPWPKGDYRVEVFLGDGTTPAATRNFKIQ